MQEILYVKFRKKNKKKRKKNLINRLVGNSPPSTAQPLLFQSQNGFSCHSEQQQNNLKKMKLSFLGTNQK